MDIKDKKKSISEQFLGVAGIHGVGLGAEDQIKIYAEDVSSDEFMDALKEISKIAAPYRVKCQKMGPASFA